MNEYKVWIFILFWRCTTCPWPFWIWFICLSVCLRNIYTFKWKSSLSSLSLLGSSFVDLRLYVDIRMWYNKTYTCVSLFAPSYTFTQIWKYLCVLHFSFIYSVGFCSARDTNYLCLELLLFSGFYSYILTSSSFAMLTTYIALRPTDPFILDFVEIVDV